MSELSLILLVFVIVCVVVMLFYYVLSVRSQIDIRARDQYELWREEELEAIRQQYAELAEKQVDVQVREWQHRAIASVHLETAEPHSDTIWEKAAEPTLPPTTGPRHNPKDARFLNTPLDFIIFDGWSEGEIRKITFVKVQKGSSALSLAERQIRNVIRHKLVEWEEMRDTSRSMSSSLDPEPHAAGHEHSGSLCPRCSKGNRPEARFCGHCGASLSA